LKIFPLSTARLWYSEVIYGRYINLKLRIAPAEISRIETELRIFSQRLDRTSNFLKILYENLVSGLITEEYYRQVKAENKEASAKIQTFP
jgi:hypothetical protein